MTTVRLTMAQALVRWLLAQRTEIDGAEAPLFPGVFAIFGHGNVTCLSEALEAVKDELPTWRGQNEQSMALAAIGFAKAKARRQVMVATSSIGPGATNMVTAAGVAHTNRLPVLLISGDYYASRLPDPVRAYLAREIEAAGGREVSFVAGIGADGVVTGARAVARGTVEMVLALPGVARRGEMLLHNHPSGRLDPSMADLNVAATLHDGGVGFGIINNSANELYGVLRLSDLVRIAPPRAEALGEAIVADVEAFCAGLPQRDDICLVCLHRLAE